MYLFVFDVESDGLYGDGFAVGAVVTDKQGNVIDSVQACSLQNVTNEWVKENVLPHLNDIPMVDSRRTVRDTFWQFYLKWKDQCHIFSDVAYPVEANFLRQCALENNGEWVAPFPLLDISSVMFACGYDPLTDGESFTGSSGAKHNPLFDASVSAKKLARLIALGKLNNRD